MNPAILDKWEEAPARERIARPPEHQFHFRDVRRGRNRDRAKPKYKDHHFGKDYDDGE